MDNDVLETLETRCSSERRRSGLASCLLVCLLVPVPASADDGVLPEAAQVSVITFGRGDHVPEYFGHNAFLLSGPAVPRPIVVNYGMFSFGPGMIPQFLRGRLHFWVGTTDLARTLAHYEERGRDVRVRDLNLEPAAIKRVLEQLRHDLRPENRVYLYDHYYDNCSTRLRDTLDRALLGQLRRSWSRPDEFTLRQQTLRYTQHDPFVAWSMMFGLNGSVDGPLSEWGTAFLPEEFERLIDTTAYVDSHGLRVPLVSGRRTLFDARRPPLAAAPARSWPALLMLGTLLGICALLLASRTRHGEQSLGRLGYAALSALLGISAGLYGTLLVTLWAFSDHLVAHHNENLLLANPLTLLAGIASLGLVGPSDRGADLLRSCWGLLGAGSLLLLLAHLLALPGFEQDIHWSVATLAPINICFAISSQRVWWNAQQHAVRIAHQEGV